MRRLLTILTLLLTWTCRGQQATTEQAVLSVSPAVDSRDTANQAIITALTGFLQTKNASPAHNPYWLAADFDKYRYPYLDICDIESSSHGTDFYRPTLMEIIATENPGQKIVKIAFIGHDEQTRENQLKSIYNLVANLAGARVLFSRYLDLATAGWVRAKAGSLSYRISPGRVADTAEIAAQRADIDRICGLFRCQPLPLTYYSCVSPKEVFEIKGFDYNPAMFRDRSGGLVEHGSLVFSGNGSERYTHEIVHIYTAALFPRINRFVDEGLATLIAGSGRQGYQWHRIKLARFLDRNGSYDPAQHTDPYERDYFEAETSIPYLSAALILERTLRRYGRNGLMLVLTSETDLWTTLGKVGLTPANLNQELRKEIKLPPLDFWQHGG